jgi:hypothetical protein
MVFVEFFLEMLRYRINSGLPTYAYWKTKIETYQEGVPKTPELLHKKYMMLNMAGRWTGMMVDFLTLVEYPTPMFQCCKNPTSVCIDGIVLSVETQRLIKQNLSSNWTNNVSLETKNRFSSRPDRHLIYLNEEQKCLMKCYVKTGKYLFDYRNFT